MSKLEDLKATRTAKLAALRKAGLLPYPARTKQTHFIKDLDASLDTKNEAVTIVGRVMSLRPQGGLIFFHVYDGTGKFQALFKVEAGKESFDLFEQTVDIGDFVEVTGTIFTTNRGERTIAVSSWNMLTKSLSPLPDKWHGLQDIDERFRKRYLDILLNKDVRDIFEKKAKFWNFTREYLIKAGFTEVETPTLETTTGGAEARPFKTHHNDFDIDVYLRISVGELWQKRLMAAGFPKTFEIGRVYRNEGSSPEHLQEFTNFEYYAAYWSYKESMEFTKNMIIDTAKHVFGTTKFTTRGHTFDLSDPWVELDYVTTIKKMTGIDVLEDTEEKLKAKLQELKVSYDGETRERLTDTLWKHCRKQISGPAFLINHPKLVSPLAKESVDNPGKTERFQLILAGAEVSNGYSELNDPIEQKERFDIQQKLIEQGDTEAMMPDFEFVEMLEYGMPPTCGYAHGDRLFAFLVDKPIREMQLFPLMRPEKASKKDEKKIATIVLNKEYKFEPWQLLNTSAHLSAVLGVEKGDTLVHARNIQTKDGKEIKLNIQHAILLKYGSSNTEIQKLAQEAKKAGLTVSEFTEEMLKSNNDKKVIAETKVKDLKDVTHLGILIFGPESVVKEITKDTVMFS